MRVLALGGAGAMGRAAVRNLLSHPEVTEVCIADRDIDATKAFIDETGSTKATFVPVDINDRNCFIELLKRHDVTLNTIGPFFRFGPKILDAAIEAGGAYVDISDEFDVIETVLAKSPDAKRAGLSAIVGCGSSPGLTNILTMWTASRFDHVTSVRMAWAMPGPASGADYSAPSAVFEHMLHSCTGDVPTFRDRERHLIPSFEIGQYFDFLPPIGRQEVFHLGHPEPLTLPTYLPGVAEVSNLGGLWPSNANAALRKRARGHEAALFPAPTPTKQAWGAPLDVMPGGGNLIEVRGVADGVPTVETLRVTGLAGGMAGVTATPAAAAAVLLAKGKVGAPGVHPPEGVIEPDPFLVELSAMYSRRFNREVDLGELVHVERQHDADA